MSIRFYTFFLSLFFLCTHVIANDVFSIDENFTGIQKVTKEITVYHDTQNNYNFDHLPSNTLCEHSNKHTLGLINHNVWTHFTLKNNTHAPMEIYLLNDRTGVDTITSKIFYEDGHTNTIKIGDMVSLSERSYKHRLPIYKITIKAHETLDIISLIRNKATTDTSWYVLNEENVNKLTNNDNLIWGLFYGILLTLLIYNINNYFILKEKVFIYYTLVTTLNMLYISSINGFLYVLDNDHLWLNNAIMMITIFSIPIFALLFTMQYLNTKSMMPKLHKVLLFIKWGLIALFVMAIIVSVIIYEPLGYIGPIIGKSFLTITNIALEIPLILGLIFLYYRKNEVILFLIGQGFYTSAFAVFMLMMTYGAEASFWVIYLIPSGVLIELILLSLALSQYVKKVKIEREQARSIIIAQSGFSTVGQTIGYIEHQWRKPLTRIGAYLTSLELAKTDEKELVKKFDSYLPNIKSNILFISDTMSHLNTLYSPKENETINFLTLLESIIEMIETDVKLLNVNIHKNFDTHINLHCQRYAISNILLILLNNSIDQFKQNGTKKNDIYLQISSSSTDMIIDYSDNAGGIHLTPIESIFDYGISTKDSLKQHGLGLSLCKILVSESLRGSIEVQNTLEGARFTITFPNKS